SSTKSTSMPTCARPPPRCASRRSRQHARGYSEGRPHGRPWFLCARACGISCAQDSYQISEIVTLRQFPNQLSSDSRWRTLEVRHVGSDTVARGFRGGAAAWLGAEDEGWAAGPAASGSCGDL